MNDEKDYLFTRNHILDIANRSYDRSCPTFTDFLNLNEQSIFMSSLNKLPPVKYIVSGGYNSVERVMIGFCPDFFEEEMIHFPINIIKVEPISQKFSEKLSHRDFLGALMNLGITRNKLGDILLDQNGVTAYIICHESISDFICENLTMIKHTHIINTICSDADINYEPSISEITGSVASIRLDNLCSLGFGISRSIANKCITEGLVFVNGRLITSNGYNPKEGDIISVRHKGRIIFKHKGNETKKGRLFIKLHKYI